MRSSSVSWSSSRNGSSHWKEAAAGLSLVWGRTLMKNPFASRTRASSRGAFKLNPGRSAFKPFVGDDLDAEAGQSLVVMHRRGEIDDRGDAEVAQDLGAAAVRAPRSVTIGFRGLGLDHGLDRHAGRDVTKVHQHA